MNVAPTGNGGEPERIDALDGVRGFAILLVVVMHAALYAPHLPLGEPSIAQHWVRFALLGWCGVDVFFVLSGFLITGILVRQKGAPHYFRNFYMRRALRILPLYYVVIVLLLFVLPRPPAPGAEIASYLLYYQNLYMAFVGQQHVDLARVVTWSLAIEEQFYLLWPALVVLASRRGLQVACMLTIVGAIMLRWSSLAAGVEKTHFLTWCRLDSLAAGAWLSLVPLPARWLGRVLAAGGLVALVATAHVTGESLPESPPMQRWGLLAALSLGVGMLILARHGGWFSRLCSLRVLASLGKYSYCIYLTHLLIIEGLIARLARTALSPAVDERLLAWPTVVVLSMFTLLCVVASWTVGLMSFHLFEKWVLSLKRHFPSLGVGGGP